MSYIYIIENDINDKKYIGKTNFSIEKRFAEHKKDAKSFRVEKRPLYNAMNKYGDEHFFISLLEEVSIDDASEREMYWINYYNTYENGYNATLGGDGKTLIDYKKVLNLFDTTLLSQKEIGDLCNCSPYSVKNIVSQYRDNVNWQNRYIKSDSFVSNFSYKSLPVICIETGEYFKSCTAAASWLVDKGKIKSKKYGRNKIPEVCRGIRKTVGGYSWKFAE